MKLATNLIAVRRITTIVSLSPEGRAKAEEMSYLMEAAGGSVTPLILVTTDIKNGGEYGLAAMCSEQVLIMEAARILRARNLQAGEMINAYVVNTVDRYTPEILQMAAMMHPDAQVVRQQKVVDWRPM